MNFYLEALLEEPLLLERATQSYVEQAVQAAEQIRAALRSGRADRILFCGMGSSAYAAFSVVPALLNGGIRAEVRYCFETLVHARGAVDSKTVLVVISQSGNTPEAVGLMRECGSQAALRVAMFNETNCALRGLAEIEMPLCVGTETPVSNKTYYAQVAQLNCLKSALLQQDLGSTAQQLRLAADWHRAYAADFEARTRPLMDFMRGAQWLDLLGDGAQYGVAQQAGLVLRELTNRGACAHGLSDYSHGWFESAREGYRMLVLADRIREMDRKMLENCAFHAGKAFVLAPEEGTMPLPAVESSLLPLYTVVPCYFLAGMLAGARR